MTGLSVPVVTSITVTHFILHLQTSDLCDLRSWVKKLISHSSMLVKQSSLLCDIQTKDVIVNTRVLGYPGPVWPTRVPTRVARNQ